MKGSKCFSSLVTSEKKSILFVTQVAIDVRQITASRINGFLECDYITAQVNSFGPDPVKWKDGGSKEGTAEFSCFIES